MRALLILLGVTFVSAFNEPKEDFIGWHQKVGIKNAEIIQRNEARIVGGAVAPTYAHPYLAGILIDVIGLSQPSACGGSLISSNRVLTAAHCWSDGRFQAFRMTVVLGSPFLFHGGLRILPMGIALHPQYDPRTFANDIAMLYLQNPVQFSSAIRPIALPFGALLNMDFNGLWARAAGYGRYSDIINPTTNVMAKNVILQIIPVQQCQAVYGDIVLPSNICTNGNGGVGICQGDSGGPLTVITADGQDILIGVSSFVSRDGCQLGFPSAFARVTSFMDWIRMHM